MPTIWVEDVATSDTHPVEPPPEHPLPSEPLDQYLRWLWR